MINYSFSELSKNNDDAFFEKGFHLKLNENSNSEYSKGIETILFECENGATLILEKNCENNKITGIEVFE